MYLTMCAMSPCQATCEVNLTRRSFVITLLGMAARGKYGGAVILPVDGATQHKMLCLMKQFCYSL